MLEELQDTLERYEKEVQLVLGTQDAHNRPLTIQYRRWAAQDFEPRRKAMTPDQDRLVERFRLCGFPGICYTLYERTIQHYEEKYRQQGIVNIPPVSNTDAHRHIIYDYRAGSERMKTLLVTAPRPLLHAVIEGNVSWLCLVLNSLCPSSVHIRG